MTEQETSQAPRRVVVAEDESLIRLDIVEILRDNGFDVVGEAGDGETTEDLLPGIASLFNGALFTAECLDRVGVHDSFFDLGGHSLLIMRLLAKVQSTFDLDISIRTVFAMPTLEAMSAEIERRIYEDVDAMSDLEAEELTQSNPDAGA